MWYMGVSCISFVIGLSLVQFTGFFRGHEPPVMAYDISNYGVEDYWANIKEFLRNSGDCEDYAILSFLFQTISLIG